MPLLTGIVGFFIQDRATLLQALAAATLSVILSATLLSLVALTGEPIESGATDLQGKIGLYAILAYIVAAPVIESITFIAMIELAHKLSRGLFLTSTMTPVLVISLLHGIFAATWFIGVISGFTFQALLYYHWRKRRPAKAWLLVIQTHALINTCVIALLLLIGPSSSS